MQGLLQEHPRDIPTPRRWAELYPLYGRHATAVTGWITSNVPGRGYKNDSVYTITVTATGTGNKVWSFAPDWVETWSALYLPGPEQACRRREYVTHNAPRREPFKLGFYLESPFDRQWRHYILRSIAVTKPVTKQPPWPFRRTRWIEWTGGFGTHGLSNLSGQVKDWYAGAFVRECHDWTAEPEGAKLPCWWTNTGHRGVFSHQFTLNQPSGIYLLRIKTDNGLLTKKTDCW